MLDVLEFYTDHQKREMEEMGGFVPTRGQSSGSSTLSPYDTGSTPRYGGTGLGGSGMKMPDSRPPMKRQESAPTGLNGAEGPNGTSAALARAAELVNGSHVQHASTISGGGSGSTMRPPIPNMTTPSLTPSRPAPQRPLLANRPAPPAPHAPAKPPLPDHTPTSADLRARAKAQGPPTETQTAKPAGADGQRRDDSLDRPAGARPPVVPAKSSPATSLPMSQPAPGAAGSLVGPAPIKPLQPKKPTAAKEAPEVKVIAAEEKDGSVAAAAAALEKPKEKEKRISTMNEAQIMEKLRSVVSNDDPKALYSKIRKVGQG